MRHRPTLRRPLSIALGLILGAASSSVLAITNDEVNSGVQFSFSNPGARSLALGGAFTGLADDATAAYANPAGLTILRTQELAFEARHTNYDTPFTAGGTVGFAPFDDSNVLEGSSSDSVFQPSFASWVVPMDGWTAAVYYQRLADFETSFTTDGIMIDAGTFTDFIFPVRTDLEFDIQNIGVAVGVELTDSFSIGASIAHSEFNLRSRTVRIQNGIDFNQQRQDGNDDSVTFGVGALWRLNDRWNFGLAYRRGAQFNYRAVNETLPGNPSFPNSSEQRPSFDVPHIISAGVAFRPSDAWLLTLDVNRVQYSELTDSNSPDLFDFTATDPTPLEVDDGTEIRFGVEYAFLNMQRPLFLRAGAWRDPDHRIRNDQVDDCVSNDPGFFNCLDATLFAPGDDEWHYSLGLGWAFEKFQIDAAADFSDLVDTYSVSGVLRF